MNTLKLSLEYHCYPVWNYDEDNNLIDNDLPEELRKDQELDALLLKIQSIFDSLYVDTSKDFSSHSFANETERQKFLHLLFDAVRLMIQRYGNRYHIESRYNQSSFPLEKR